MRSFSTVVDIDASAARVWSVMRDIEHWHESTASVRSIERLDDGPLVVGSRARIRQPKVSLHFGGPWGRWWDGSCEDSTTAISRSRGPA